MSNDVEHQGGGSRPEPHPRDGHIRVPNEVVDRLAQLQVSGAEWQIIFATWRRTLAWQHSGEWRNEPYPISLGDLARATGLARRHIVRQVKDLARRNILKRAPGDRKHLLCFNMDYTTWVVTKQSLVTKRSLGSAQMVTTTSDQTVPSLVTKQSLVPASNHASLNKPKQAYKERILNKPRSAVSEETAGQPLGLKKSKPYQAQAGRFLDLVVEKQGVRLIQRGKLIKAVRAVFASHPNTTSEKLLRCFAWLKENDSFCRSRDSPTVIMTLPSKYPEWAAGKLPASGGKEEHGEHQQHSVPDTQPYEWRQASDEFDDTS